MVKSLGMKILAILMGIRGILSLIGVLILIFGGISVLEEAGLGNLVGPTNLVVGAVLGIAYIVGTIFVFKSHPIGWWITLVWMVIETIRPIGWWLAGFGIFAIPGLIIGLLLIWYIFRKRKDFSVKLPVIDK